MAYGAQIRTNKGLTDLFSIVSARQIHRSVQSVNGSNYSTSFNLSVGDISDLSGPVVITGSCALQSDTSQEVYISFSENNYYDNISSVPSTINVRAYHGGSGTFNLIFLLMIFQGF